MIRLLIFFLWIAFFAAALTLLFTMDAAIPVEAFGWRLDIPAGLAIVMTLVFAALVALATSAFKDVLAAPGIARARKEIRRRENGLAAVTRGLEAIAMGDGAAARREARIAAKALSSAPVAKLIAAQAAQLSGDDAAAGEALAGMLDEPETEFLALRGLYAKAMRGGDMVAAASYAERAFNLRNKARWAFEAVFDLALARNDFAAAREALARAVKSNAIGHDAGERGLAATLGAAAYASHAAGDISQALTDADAAIKRSPGFAPAAVLSARLHAARGDLRKADKTLQNAFAIAPERAILETLEEIHSAESAEERAAAYERLAARNPESREAAIARALAALARGDARLAEGALFELLKSSAQRRALALMAEVKAALKGEGDARIWLARAAAAPRDETLGADVFFRITGEGWRRLIHEYRENGRLSPPPLEAPPPGLSDDELGLPTPRPALAPADIDGDLALEVETAKEADANAEEALDREAAAARGVS